MTDEAMLTQTRPDLKRLIEQDNLSIMFMGMSGIGKTTIANRFSKQSWFHYSIDYRIGTRYLSEPIMDELKSIMTEHPVIQKLLRDDAITVNGNMTVDNLSLLTNYVGLVGNTELGGLDYQTFSQRQHEHYLAEIAAVRDIPDFQLKAQKIYNYPHFIIDSSGSIAEMPFSELETLVENTLIVYIKAPDDLVNTLVERAIKYPKPLYYEAGFLRESIDSYLNEKQLTSVDEIPPTEFAQWVFPHLIEHRLPRYQAIADNYGITIPYHEIADLQTSDEILSLFRRYCH